MQPQGRRKYPNLYTSLNPHPSRKMDATPMSYRVVFVFGVSIPIHLERWMQLPLRFARPWSARRFNPHPSRKMDATTLAWRRGRRARRFNPHPSRKMDATSDPALNTQLSRWFQSPSISKDGCNDKLMPKETEPSKVSIPIHLERWMQLAMGPFAGFTLSQFQSPSISKDGCNLGYIVAQVL